jgi:hypothetical protein
LEGVSGMLYNKQISFLRLQLNYKSWKSIYWIQGVYMYWSDLEVPIA